MNIGKDLGPVSISDRTSYRRSCKFSKPRDLYLELSDRSDIWQAPRQHRCRGAFQISKRYQHFKTRSSTFDTLRYLTIRRLIGYWNGAQMLPHTVNIKANVINVRYAWQRLWCKFHGITISMIFCIEFQAVTIHMLLVQYSPYMKMHPFKISRDVKIINTLC